MSQNTTRRGRPLCEHGVRWCPRRNRVQAFLRARRAGFLAFFGSGGGASVATDAILEN
jgi:hypothetical protein